LDGDFGNFLRIKASLREVMQREGPYLLCSNLTEHDSAQLWRLSMLLVEERRGKRFFLKKCLLAACHISNSYLAFSTIITNSRSHFLAKGSCLR
jgi:hypothetical protein